MGIDLNFLGLSPTTGRGCVKQRGVAPDGTPQGPELSHLPSIPDSLVTWIYCMGVACGRRRFRGCGDSFPFPCFLISLVRESQRRIVFFLLLCLLTALFRSGAKQKRWRLIRYRRGHRIEGGLQVAQEKEFCKSDTAERGEGDHTENNGEDQWANGLSPRSL